MNQAKTPAQIRAILLSIIEKMAKKCRRERFCLTHIFVFFLYGVKRRSRQYESSIPRSALIACLRRCLGGMRTYITNLTPAGPFGHPRHHAS